MARSGHLALWLPRALGLAMAAFLALFAADAVEEGILSLLLHLIPALVVLAVVAVGWRRPRWAAVGHLALAVFYAWESPRWDWTLAISGPLVVAAMTAIAAELVVRARERENGAAGA
ncbi:MAG: hypothetical protein R3F20_16315 [Planctomycetota bacterium]